MQVWQKNHLDWDTSCFLGKPWRGCGFDLGIFLLISIFYFSEVQRTGRGVKKGYHTLCWRTPRFLEKLRKGWRELLASLSGGPIFVILSLFENFLLSFIWMCPKICVAHLLLDDHKSLASDNKGHSGACNHSKSKWQQTWSVVIFIYDDSMLVLFLDRTVGFICYLVYIICAQKVGK